ncbi:hypothetical protein LINGRAPRIM_LOCUS3125 [Linum grandiflorum]
MPRPSWDWYFPDDQVHAARSLISEIKNRLEPNKFQHFKDTLPRLTPTADSPANTARIVQIILDGQTDLIKKFNAFLPEQKKYRAADVNTKPAEIRVPPACVEAVKLWMRDKKVLKSVWKEALNSCKRGEIRKEDLVMEIAELLQGERELLQEFASLLPVTEATPISVNMSLMEEGEIRAFEAKEEQRNRNRGKSSEKEEEEEESKSKPKRAKKSSENKNPNYEILRNKIFNSAMDNPERVTLSLPSLYCYSKGIRFNPANLPVECQTLFRLQPIKNEVRKRKRGAEKETKEEYRSSGTRMVYDPAVELMNKIEEDRYHLDMVGGYLNSAADYIEGKQTHEIGQIHLRKCVEAMYESAEEVAEMAMENPEFLDRIVKKRVSQKAEELRIERERLQRIWKDAIAAAHCKSVTVE